VVAVRARHTFTSSGSRARTRVHAIGNSTAGQPVRVARQPTVGCSEPSPGHRNRAAIPNGRMAKWHLSHQSHRAPDTPPILPCSAAPFPPAFLAVTPLRASRPRRRAARTSRRGRRGLHGQGRSVRHTELQSMDRSASILGVLGRSAPPRRVADRLLDCLRSR
jgi:hypothetical protein